MIVTTSGDLGDLVVMLGTLKATPGKHTVLLRDDGRTKGIVKRQHLITPLVKSQPYIEDCRPWVKGDTVDWESEKFRNGFHRSDDTLFNAHASWAIEDGVIQTYPDHRESWLEADPSPKTKGKILISRSSRYNNPLFPWRQLCLHFGKRLVFIGLKDEHVMLQNAFGVKVAYQETKDLLDVAKLIAGSDMFIGNQSSPMTIAEGLKHPRVQEICLHVPDCVYPPDGSNQYSATGDVEIEDFKHTYKGFDVRTLDTRVIPRGGWRATINEVTEIQSTLQLCAKYLARKAKVDYSVAETEILRQTLKREPQYFAKQSNTTKFNSAARALRGAGWSDDHPTIRLINGNAPFYVS